MSRQSWRPEVFDRLYAERPDPWDFATSPYEQEKYADTLAQLGTGRFARALELGCSIGVFSELLAQRCDRLLGLDAAEAAIEAARTRLGGADHVAFRRATLPGDWPSGDRLGGSFDLIVVSELLYFLAPDDIATLARRCVEAAGAQSTILLVNWTGVTDTPTTGNEAATLFRSAALSDTAAVGCTAAWGFTADRPLLRPQYRIDRLRRPAPLP